MRAAVAVVGDHVVFAEALAANRTDLLAVKDVFDAVNGNRMPVCP